MSKTDFVRFTVCVELDTIERSLGTFVENRMKEIKTDKNISFHCNSTTENPADKASHGTSTRELRDDRIWWHGPEWLGQSQQTWAE